MQDIVVYISLETAAKEKETLLPLILSFEGEFAYKEYNSAEAVRLDFTAEDSATAKAAAALFDQIKLESSPGRVKKVAVLGVSDSATPGNVTEALDTLRETHDDWYFLLPTVAAPAMITALADWADATVLTLAQLEAGQVEAEKLLVVQTSSKDVIDTAMKDKRQVVIVYNHDAENSFIPAAWVGRTAPNYPKSVTWKWKELYGIPVTSEQGIDLQDLLEGRYNLYIHNHGRDYMSEGICTDGDFIDIVIGRWQIKQAMRRNLVNMFVDNEVVGYDDEGFTQVGAQIIAALEEAVDNGIVLRQDGAGAFAVEIPKRADASDDQAANRVMPPIPWTATVRGGVHGVKIAGVLTVALTGSET